MKKELGIHLYITEKCNLKCNHCYNAKWINNPQPTKLLSLSEIIQIIKILHQKYTVDFHIEGGETFLWEHIDSLLSGLSDDVLKTITFTTNGTINLLQFGELLEKVGNVRFSICGHTDELQNMIRNIPLKPVLENMEVLKKYNIPLSLRMTLHKRNFKVLLDSIEYFTGRDFYNISIYEFQNVGRGSEYESIYLMNESEFSEFLQLLENNTFWNRLNNFRINLNSSRVDLVKLHQKRLESKGFKVKMLDIEHSLTVNYNGEIGICPWILGDDKIAELNINSFDTQIEHLYNNDMLLHTCKHCSVISIYK